MKNQIFFDLNQNWCQGYFCALCEKNEICIFVSIFKFWLAVNAAKKLGKRKKTE